MKKSAIAIAALYGAMLAANAQNVPSPLVISNGPNSLQLYGLIDVSYISQSNANTNGDSLVAPRTAWFSGNRWGLNGKHATGGAEDLNVIFRLESEFESQTGNMDTPGVLFNRDSWVGMESKSLGKLTVGRQNALGRDPAASGAYGDPFGGKASLEEGGYSNNNNYKQLIFYAGSATGTRMDDSVVWKKNFGGLIAGLAHQFGTTAGNFTKATTTTASLAYNGDNYTLAGFATTANVNGLTHQTLSVGGNVAVGPMVRLFGGYYDYKAQQAAALSDRHDTAYTVSAKISPSAKYDFAIGYQSMQAQSAAVNGSGYALNAYADASTATAVVTGNRNTIYGAYIYHVDAVTDLYAVADQLTTTGGYLAAQANGFTSQTEFGVGMKFKF